MEKSAAAPVWLFTGPELGERNNSAKSVLSSLEKKYGDVEKHSLYFGDSSMGQVISLLQNGSLFSSAKLITLKSAELIKKKEDIEMLLNWISSAKKTADNNAFLILISDEISVTKKIKDAVPKSQQKVFWEMFENKKQDWIRNYFRKENITIEEDAINELLELVENNTDALKTACSHLVLFFEKGATVSQDDIEKLFAHNKEETAFTLFNALSLGDLESALSINQKLLLSKNSSPIQTIAGLLYCFRRLNDWHRIHSENAYLDDFALKRNGFTSKKMIDQYRRAAKFWNAVECAKIIAELSECDMQIRSMGTALHSLAMELCLYQIVAKKGASLSKFELALPY